MHTVFVLAVIFGGIVLSLGVVGGTLLMIIKMRHDGLSRGSRHRQAEEAGMIQEIYRGLSRLEQRVEALETLLMDPGGKER